MVLTLPKIRITETAAKAIVDQADYYAAQQDEALALRWEDSVSRVVQSLLKMPERGSLCHFRATKLKTPQRIPMPWFSQHNVFYQYIREERAIRIVHVLHGARDVETLLASQPPP